MYYYKIYGNQPIKVVIEMGLGACLEEWEPFAELISKEMGVLLYERAGINRSDLSTNQRTPIDIAQELNEFLVKLHIEHKIILVGHSQEGLYAFQFAMFFPDKVEKLILIDPLSFKDNEFKRQLTEAEYKKSGVDKSNNFRIMRILAKLKLRFITKSLMKKAPPFYYYSNFSKQQMDGILSSYGKITSIETSLAEYQNSHEEKNLKQFYNERVLPLPIVLITHSSEVAIKENMEFGRNTLEFATKVENLWQDLMKIYLSFSDDSTWVQAKHSGHYIHLTEPEIIIENIS